MFWVCRSSKGAGCCDRTVGPVDGSLSRNMTPNISRGTKGAATEETHEGPEVNQLQTSVLQKICGGAAALRFQTVDESPPDGLNPEKSAAAF